MSKKNIISVTVDSYDGDLESLVADFTSELMEVLNNYGIEHISIRIINISYTTENRLVVKLIWIYCADLNNKFC